MGWLSAAKKRMRFLELGRAAWDSPDSQPVSIEVHNAYTQVYREATFSDLPRALMLLERAQDLLDVQRTDLDDICKWLHDLEE